MLQCGQELATGCAGLGLLGGAGHVQPLPVLCLGFPGVSYKVICRWLPLVLGLQVRGGG